MSLAHVLKDYSIKAKFKERFSIPKIPHTKILVPPLTEKTSVIGTAFNYITRFHIKERFPNAVTRRWVAEEAINFIKSQGDGYMLVDGTLRPLDHDTQLHIQARHTGCGWKGLSCVRLACGHLLYRLNLLIEVRVI